MSKIFSRGSAFHVDHYLPQYSPGFDSQTSKKNITIFKTNSILNLHLSLHHFLVHIPTSMPVFVPHSEFQPSKRNNYQDFLSSFRIICVSLPSAPQPTHSPIS